MSQLFINPPRVYTGREFEMWTQRVSALLSGVLERVICRTGVASPVGAITPAYVGEPYIDTAAHKVYVAENLTNISWLLMN
jgi:hypothetical protein